MSATPVQTVFNAAWSVAGVPRLSVVIPTCRRPDTLPRVLDALAVQNGVAPTDFEVVVGDDASGDNTTQTLQTAAARANHPMAWFSLTQHGGPARVRNAALQLARAPVALLLGDDILAPPDLVARHIAWHTAHPAWTDALLGHSIWDETMPPNALMRWLESGGRRFAFDYQVLSAGQPVSGFSFYTCHVSFKRGLFQRAGGFDESFPFASHEDLELGLRMERQGMRLYYDPTLIVRHWHWLDMASVCRRIYNMGYSSVEFWRKNSASLSAPRAFARRMVMRCFEFATSRRAVLCLAGRTLDLTRARPLRWTLLLYGMYWIGVADAAKGRSAVPPPPV